MLPEVKHYPLVDIETVGTQKIVIIWWTVTGSVCISLVLYCFANLEKKTNPNAIIVDWSELTDPKNI